MKESTMSLYKELEGFIKERTDTWGDEEKFIKKLNEYTVSLRDEAQEYGHKQAREYTDVFLMSLHDLVEKSIKEHNANDDKVRCDIEAHFEELFKNAQRVPSRLSTHFKPEWLVMQAFARVAGKFIRREYSDHNHERYVIQLADEMLAQVSHGKSFVVGKKLASTDKIIFDDVLKPQVWFPENAYSSGKYAWIDIKKQKPDYGRTVNVTFNGVDKEEGTFEEAVLVSINGEDTWSYKSGYKWPLDSSAVKGWKYAEKQNDWIDITKSRPMFELKIEVRIGNGDGWKKGDRIAKNVVVRHDLFKGDYFDYSGAEWNYPGENDDAPTKFYVKDSAVTHWRYM